jgi:hypothetical protein
MSKPMYNFGDLVIVIGHYPNLFEVDGRRTEHWEYADEEWTDIVYELYDTTTNDWIEAAEEDLTLVIKADKAEEYLALNPRQYEAPAPSWPDWMTFGIEGDETMSKAKEPRKPTAREISSKEAEEKKQARKARAAEIDNLLDIAHWNRRMLEKTNDERYGDQLFAVEAELKKLVETE